MVEHETYESAEQDKSTGRDEPYRGVASLFNADLHVVCPQWAPREDWRILSEFVIRHVPKTPENSDCLENTTINRLK